MSDPNLSIQRQIQELQASLEVLRKSEVTPQLLSYAQRAVNPVAATAGLGDFGQPWAIYPLAFYVNVFVTTTNNGTNFWTIDLQDTTGSVIASVSTSAIAANTYTRLSDLSVTVPATTNAMCIVVATKTLSPGSLYAVPGLSVLRTGN